MAMMRRAVTVALASSGRSYVGEHTVTALSVGTCFGYIWGVVAAGDRSSFCIPNGVKQLQVIDVVKQWIDQHPALRHYTAASLITEALKESFPCKQ